MLSPSKSKRRRPTSGSKKLSKKRMPHRLVSKKLLIKLQNIYKMILPLYIKYLKNEHPDKKVDEKFVLKYSLNIFKQALNQQNLKRLKGGSNGAWVKPKYKNPEEYRHNEELYDDNRLNSNDFKLHEVRTPSPNFPILEGEPNYDFLKYLVVGLGFYFVMIKFLFN